MSITTQQLRDEEEALRDDIRALNDEQRKEYYRLERQAIKDPDTYAVLNYFFLGGLHHFYLGKFARGLFNLVITVLGLIFLFVLPLLGFALIIFVFLIELPKLIRAQRIIHQYNNDLMRHTIAKIKRGDSR